MKNVFSSIINYYYFISFYLCWNSLMIIIIWCSNGCMSIMIMMILMMMHYIHDRIIMSWWNDLLDVLVLYIIQYVVIDVIVFIIHSWQVAHTV